MRRMILAALCAALAGPAAGFQARNGMSVSAEPGGFAVAPLGGRAGARDFWCAAGDYAERVLDLPPATRIYRANGGWRRGGQPMRFTLDPAAAAQRSGLLKLPRTADLTVAHARLFCNSRQFR